MAAQSIPTAHRGEQGISETVQQKGLRLYRAGAVKHLQGDKWLVRGDHGEYEVDYAKQLCGCPSRVYCSHRYSVEIAAAKEHTAALKKLQAKREEVKKRGAYRPDTSLNDSIETALKRMEV